MLLTSTVASDRPRARSRERRRIVAGDNPFVLSDRCIPAPDQCHSYCEDTCLRSVTFAIDPANTEDYTLRVCDENSDICAQLDGRYWYYEDKTELETAMRNTLSDKLRYFGIALPNGPYTAAFLDGKGRETWPTFVDTIYEDAICDDALLEGSIVVHTPPLREDECYDLIRNGNAEESDSLPLYWLHRRGGIALNTTQGRNGTNAFGDVEPTDSSKDSISQYIDTRCLSAMVDSQYEITAWVKLIDTVNGEPYTCNVDAERCPQVGIFAYSQDDGSWTQEPVATMVNSGVDDDGYQLVQGVVDINEEFASASSVLIFVERNKGNLAMLVDDISMKAMDDRGVVSGTGEAPQDTIDPIKGNDATSNAGDCDQVSARLIVRGVFFMLLFLI